MPPKKFDKAWLGFLCGLFSPLITFYGFYLIKYGDRMSFSEFYLEVLVANNILTAILSLCVITNLLVFFLFIWTHRNYAARGVLFSTIIYAFFVVYQKYLK